MEMIHLPLALQVIGVRNVPEAVAGRITGIPDGVPVR